MAKAAELVQHEVDTAVHALHKAVGKRLDAVVRNQSIAVRSANADVEAALTRVDLCRMCLWRVQRDDRGTQVIPPQPQSLMSCKYDIMNGAIRCMPCYEPSGTNRMPQGFWMCTR